MSLFGMEKAHPDSSFASVIGEKAITRSKLSKSEATNEAMRDASVRRLEGLNKRLKARQHRNLVALLRR